MIYLKYFASIFISIFGFLLFILAIGSSTCSPCSFNTGVLYMFCPYASTFCLTLTSSLSALGSTIILSVLLYKIFVKIPIITTNKYNADSLAN
jgi:hypothetical protein